jgi:thiosulfate dehydrogenase [quinone] large subunit
LSATPSPNDGRWQHAALVVLRLAIGWHFLYEGFIKVTHPAWSAAGYLERAVGPFAGAFHWMAANPTALRVVDLMNEIGLLAVGLGLMAGLLTRAAAVGGMLMLALYYLSNPPWIGVLAAPGEGNYLWVDKNLVEFLALVVIVAFDTGKMAGLDLALHEWIQRLRAKWAQRKQARASAATAAAQSEEASK